MLKSMQICVTLLVVMLATGCATWRYSVRFDPQTAGVNNSSVQVAYEPGIGDVGKLTVSNASNGPVYLVWDDLSQIKGGTQTRVYKGSVRVIHQEMSVPKQMISPGATLVETVVADARVQAVAKRPPVPMDLILGWAYGLGVYIGNRTWKPGDDDIKTALPNWAEAKYTMVVPLEIDGARSAVELPVVAGGVKTERVVTPK
jgi:hypothetical protein